MVSPNAKTNEESGVEGVEPCSSSFPMRATDAGSVFSGNFLEADKRAVYRHPLFPLLALLFEKCEDATNNADCPSSENFAFDLQAFIQHQKQDSKPFFSSDPEVDNLMIRSIQVLRIHLLELEKVQELCKDFCTRYINSLKGKMHSENLLKSEYNYDSDSSGPSDGDSGMGEKNGSDLTCGISSRNLNPSNRRMAVVAPTCYDDQMAGGSPMSFASTSKLGSRSVGASSSRGVSPLEFPGYSSGLDLSRGGEEDEESCLSGKRKNKRGVLPKQATAVLKSWLFQHLVHPYPTEDEKRNLASQTNLTLLQVNNWFINARRRILQPMLDASSGSNIHSTSNSAISDASYEDSMSPKAKRRRSEPSASDEESYETSDVGDVENECPDPHELE